MEQQCNHRSIDGILLNDIMSEILSRLHVKSLLRFRSVCKDWKSLITSYSFRHLHRERHRSSLPLIITCHDSDYGIGDEEPGMMDYYLTAFDLHGNFIQKYTLPVSSELLSMIPLPSQSKLFCFECDNFGFDDASEKLYSYNPSTRQLFCVPDPPCYSFPDCKRRLPTLGYFPSNDEYMLVILFDKNPLERWVCDVLTFSISDNNFELHYNEWRTIKVTTKISCSGSSVFVCGVFYWEALDENGNECILSFDVETKVFSTFRLPETPFRRTLLELKDELYVMSENDDRLILNLWKLCTDGNKSWTLYKTFNLQNLGFTEDFNDQRAFNWEIFVYRLEYLQCYNEPNNVLLEMGMLKLEDDDDVLEDDDDALEEVDVIEDDDVLEEAEYIMPDWTVNIHTNLFTL